MVQSVLPAPLAQWALPGVEKHCGRAAQPLPPPRAAALLYPVGPSGQGLAAALGMARGARTLNAWRAAAWPAFSRLFHGSPEGPEAAPVRVLWPGNGQIDLSAFEFSAIGSVPRSF